MLSPVSPSATGNTLRSLTSSRLDSRCARPPATAALKRTRLVSVTARPCVRARGPGTCSDGLGDLAGLEAAGAHVHAAWRGAHQDSDLLEVGIEASLGGDHRVTPALAEGGSPTAAVTDLGHGGHQ